MLAVSFCNIGRPSGQILAIIDTDTGDIRVLDLEENVVDSGLGLAQDDRFLYAACARQRDSFLAVFEKTSFKLENFLLLPEVIDVHSICLLGQNVIAVSTGTDEVVAVSLEDGAAESEVLWRPNLSRADTHHLNAVAYASEHLLCSGFGPRSGERWSTARKGYVYDVTLGEVIADGIVHPHSIVQHEKTLYFCESSLSTLRTIESPIVSLDGYVRGLAFSGDGTCFVGSSVGRYDPLIPRQVSNPADPGRLSGRCAIYRVSVENGALARPKSTIDLSSFGNEIYDLLWFR